MSNFVPGAEVHRFSSKSGDEIIIRYPLWEDLDELVRYINKISREDTYITFSGETISKEEEVEYLIATYRNIEKMDSVVLFALKNGQLIGSSDIHRVFSHRRRGQHIGTFGITIEQEYREQGIGFELAKQVIEESKRKIRGLELITLDVYSENERAVKMYEKIGFTKYGELPEGLKYKDRLVGEVKMMMKL
jgi:RimJ/RimL family protein N-acetyltransferase